MPPVAKYPPYAGLPAHIRDMLRAVCNGDDGAAERYAHAGELAADLQRWLDGRPVAARPAGTLWRGWRWCQRSRAPVLSSLPLLLAGLLDASWALVARWQNTSENCLIKSPVLDSSYLTWEQ